MKSFRKKILTCILLFASAICLVLAGCSTKEVKLSFETNGGAPIEEIVAVVGDEVTLPTPEREGYSFEGWYESADFSGSAVTSVVAERSKTFYAKWEQMYEIKFELGGGQLSVSKLYAKAGETIADLVKDQIPTLTGWQFGEWLLNGAALSPSAKMPQSEITLTAHYKVGYTVHVWLQNAALDGFEQGEDIVGYDYPAANYTPDVTVKGYEVTEHEGEVKSGTLSENPASNEFTFYFERGHYQLTLLSNYPGTMEDESETIDFIYGQEITLPFDRFKPKGCLLTGWSRSVVGEVDYPSQVLDGLLRNGDGVAREDKVSLDEDTTLYAIWANGYADLFGGEDFIYHLQGETDRIILERYGSYYQGEYNASTESFFFFLDENADEIFLQGKLLGSGFAYYNEARDGQIYYRYVVGRGVFVNEMISLDSYNGIRYTVKGTNVMGIPIPDSISQGTYYIDDEGYWCATFTEGDKSGTELTMLFGSVTVDGAPMRVFMAREDDDVSHGEMYFCGIMDDGQMGAVPNAYLLTLDGFGSAVMNMGTSKTNYLYVIVSEDTFFLYTTGGSLYGTFKFVKFGTREGYMLYDSALDIKATDNFGNTLELDGACNAVVTVGGTPKSGYYTAEDSAFGGYIVTVYLGEEKHIYLVSTQTGENNTVKIVFEEKDAGYAEYYYKDAEGTYYTPLLVIDDAEGKKASVYGYTRDREFLKVAEGSYVYNEQTGNYQFTVEKSLSPEGELILDPIDVTRLSSFVYSLGVASGRNVSYWYSVTYGEEDPTKFDKKYDDTAGTNGTLILVGGFAVYRADAEESVVAGTYSSLRGFENVIRVQNGNTYLYFELNESESKFRVLDDRIGTLTERLASGQTDSSVTLSFDGKGGATLTVTHEEGDPTVTKGTYSEANATVFETPVLHFNPESGEDGFDFMILSTSSASYFTRLAKDAKELTSEKDGELLLDGFSYKARYTDADGNVIDGRYTVPEEGVILFTDEDVTVAYYFDVKEESTFTLRGAEAATYLLFDNQYIDGTAFRFDGYGKLTVVRLADSDEEEEEVIGNGEYRREGDQWVLSYEDNEGSQIEITGLTGLYAVSSTSAYRVFIIEQKEICRVYINEEDWSVLVPDGRGNAELRTKFGTVERGTYVIINEELLYYVNSSNTDACIYRYDVETGTISKLNYSEHGYYTADLRSLRFSRYGFMIMDGETRYYYTVDGNDEITVYLRDPDNANANKYGFVAEKIGTFADRIVFKGVTYIDNNGFSIRFEREESTKDNYPVLYNRDEDGNEIKKPLRLLTFQPTGSAEFRVTGAVSFDGVEQALQCTVVREIVSEEGAEEVQFALYLLIAGYRFDLDVTYNGEEGNVYRVLGLSYIQNAVNSLYYDIYYLFAMLGYSGTLANTYGEISIVREYDEQGEQTEQYLNVDLGAQNNIRLLDGTAITKLEHEEYVFDEETGLYVVTQVHDGCTYKFYFSLTVHSYFRVPAYSLVACTRVQTLESEGYTVEIERLLATDVSGRIGSPYAVSLKKGETKIDIETIFVLSDKTYCVSRTREHLDSDEAGVNSGKILSTTYYELVLTDKDPEQVEGGSEDEEGEEGEEGSETAVGIVPLYDTVTVTEHAADHYGDSYNNVDIFKNGQVAGFMRGGTQYFATSTTHDEATDTYTVTATDGHRYAIKLEEKDGEKRVTVTRLQDVEEEQEEQGEEN